MQVNEAEIWRRIVELEGEEFVQLRGGRFRFEIRGNALAPDRTNRLLPRSSFRQAIELMPVDGPGRLQHLQGPSYLYAILMDPRVRGTDW